MTTDNRKKLRDLHFAGTYFPVQGGTTTRIYNMLASPENEHLLMVPWPTSSQYPEGLGKICAEETRDHIHIRRVALPRSLRWARRLAFFGNWLMAKEFAKQAGEQAVDILHGHNPRACAMASLHFKRRYGLPMVYEVHGIMQDDANFPLLFGPAGPLNRMSWWLSRQTAAYFERQVLHIADRLIVQTQSIRDRLIELYDLPEKPIDVIRNGVDTEEFEPTRWQDQRISLRLRRGWQDKIICLYAGYLNKVNGIDFLLDNLPRLSAAARGRLKIVLLGRGPLQYKVEQTAKEHSDLIDFPGTVAYNQMPAYYAASDVFMIPRPPSAPAETLLPMKLLEAMAMEKTVLVSNVKAMAEVVTNGQNGLVFEKADSSDFLSKLGMIAEGRSHLEKLGPQARQDVLDKYTWQASRKQLQSVYETLVQGQY